MRYSGKLETELRIISSTGTRSGALCTGSPLSSCTSARTPRRPKSAADCLTVVNGGDNIELAEDLLHGCPPGRRGWEWHYVKRLAHLDRLTLESGSPSAESG